MSPQSDRQIRYSRRREARLDSLRQLRHSPAGTSRAYYVADQLLVIDEDRSRVERYLSDHHARNAKGDEELQPGVRRYHVTGLDVPAAVREMRRAAPGRRSTVAPNHVFLSSPFNHGGPFGPPTPIPAATLAAPDRDTASVAVAIIDTGLWADTGLPMGYLDVGNVEFETATDIDSDGLLDGDVGHANFVAGVVAAHSPTASLSVLKVLDTFGVCSEDQLISALNRLEPGTKVVNMSLGGYTDDDSAPLGLGVALANALSGKDRVVVAAAGNDGNHTNRFWPAAFAGSGDTWSSKVVAVAAHNGTHVCDWSNTGDWVSFAAPGQNIDSTFINHTGLFPEGWASWSGTSFAAPRVAAAIAARIDSTTGATAALAALTAATGTFIDGHRALL